MSILTPVQPRVAHFPAASSSAGREVIDLAREAGLDLMDWQQFVLDAALAERPDGRWAAFEVGVVVSRQNGKGGIEEARELGGLFILGERLIIHSAHQFDTSLEAFRRLLFLVENTEYLSRRVKRVSRAHGEEGIELTNGQRVRFRTRTKGGGRGFSGDCLVLDEAMILPESAHGALLPTLSARPNPQVWYCGSAVDQNVHDHGVVFARLRERGIRGDDPSLAFFEWSALPDGDSTQDEPNPSAVPPELLDDHGAWARANPSLGILISGEHIERERASMDPRTFAVERLGIGDWPETNPSAKAVIDVEAWRSLVDASSTIEETLVFAFDVTPERDMTSICSAGRRKDGLIHVEVVDRRPGTGWVPRRLKELVARHKPVGVVYASKSPAMALRDKLAESAIDVEELTTEEYVTSCGALFDLVAEKGLRHLGTPEIETAIRGAAKRPLVDAWAWSRKQSKVDISPLVAATIAAGRVLRYTPEPAPFIFEALT